METKLSGGRPVEAAPRHRSEMINGRRALVEGGSDLAPKNAKAPVEREVAAITESRERNQARARRFQVKAEVCGDALKVSAPDSGDLGFRARAYDAFGTTSEAFARHEIGRVGSIMRENGAALPTQNEMNAALAAIDGMRPADEIEAMLAVQMVATHEVAMDMLARAKRADRMPILQESGSLAVKLLRTYTAQVEALARLRRGGEQRVIVQHVNVNEGGQAIVGAVNQPGAKNERQPHARPMRRSDPIRRAMPRGQGRWKKPLSDAWRRCGQRRAQGRAEWELATRAIHMRGHRRAGGNTGLASIGS